MNNQQEENTLPMPAKSWSKPEILVLDVKEETLGGTNGGADGLGLS